jgi:hypothetical protein
VRNPHIGLAASVSDDAADAKSGDSDSPEKKSDESSGHLLTRIRRVVPREYLI